MRGFVYILSNPSLPEQLKIGKSETDPIKRAAQLYSSGVPNPFTVEYFAFVGNFDAVEKRVHRRLGSYRVKRNREFFRCPVPIGIDAVRQEADKNIFYEETPNGKKSHQNSMRGFIYIFSNPVLKQRLKIGKSKSDPLKTVRRLPPLAIPDLTESPTPFEMEYYALVENCDEVEQVIHKKLAPYHVNKEREFFSCPIQTALDVVHQAVSIAGSKILFEEITAEQKRKLAAERNKREEEARKKRQEEAHKKREEELRKRAEEIEKQAKTKRFREMIFSSGNYIDRILFYYEKNKFYIKNWIFYFFAVEVLIVYYLMIYNSGIFDGSDGLFFVIALFIVGFLSCIVVLYSINILLLLGFMSFMGYAADKRLRKYKNAVGLEES